MFSFSTFKKKPDRFIIDKWAKLYQEKLFSDPIFKSLFDQRTVSGIYFLFFCIDINEHKKRITTSLEESKIQDIKSIIKKTPMDFDSNDYPVIQVFEIKSAGRIFAVITTESESYTNFKIQSIIERTTSLVENFETSKPIL